LTIRISKRLSNENKKEKSDFFELYTLFVQLFSNILKQKKTHLIQISPFPSWCQ